MKAIVAKADYLDLFYKWGIYIVFISLIAVFSIMTPNFYSSNNIINILQQSASMGIAVVGMVFVILTAGIDLSAGTIIFFSAVVTAMFVSKGLSFLPGVIKYLGLEPSQTLVGITGLILTIIVSLICGALIGAINGLVISKWKVVPFIATLATMNFGRGITYAISGTDAQYLNGPVAEIVNKTRILGIPIVIYFLILLTAIGHFILTKTQFGRQIYAIGNNAAAAEKVGINVRKRTLMVYIIAGMLAGFSGFIASAQVGAVNPNFGQGQEFIVIIAAVLGGVSLFGGKGNIFPGALVGVLIIMCIENGLVLISANPYAYTVVRGVVIFIAVMIDCARNKGELR